jgi:hypothetical protein
MSSFSKFSYRTVQDAKGSVKFRPHLNLSDGLKFKGPVKCQHETKEIRVVQLLCIMAPCCVSVCARRTLANPGRSFFFSDTGYPLV